ncbi:MAG: TIGR03085 family metal-binding protein [Dermatophilaceae bacterium]
MTRFAQNERHALCDTFERVGPEAPTLCSPWLTKDLAAHLVVRERRPDAAAGILVPGLAGRTEQVQNEYAAWEWPRLVEQVRTGPPPWSPASIGRVDEALNTAEFFVHHEDVLRGGEGWTARELPADLERALWGIVSGMARLRYSRSRVGVVLVAPGLGRRQAHALTGLGTVVVKGTPGELLLHSFGRRGVAQIDISGPEEALAAL